ncbi:hypothetical protein [Williamsia sterculiae]|uniref:Mce-associated membrane protein n=1 Tax=Williamsia sterculiae TaxID=1344003 RepID=A0A1N7GNS0_9NOCA|nr:hypothetical protein [Williamsia sterculiae]SIS14213.1 Mce-associated membrane protein [Williamsia sterculiae]
MSDARENVTPPTGDLDEFTPVDPDHDPTPGTEPVSSPPANGDDRPGSDAAGSSTTPKRRVFRRRRADATSGAEATAPTPGREHSSAKDIQPQAAKRGRRPSAKVAGIVAAVAMVAALVVAGWFLTTYVIALMDDHDDNNTAQIRDDALSGADQAMLNVTNVDPADLNGFKKRAASTFYGNVEQQLSEGGFDALAKAGPNAGKLTSTIARSSLVELNTQESTGKALVYVTVTAKRPQQASSSQTLGFQVDIRKDGDIWKAQNIQALDGIQSDDTAAAATTAPAAPATTTPAAPAPATPAPAAPAATAPAAAPTTGGN